MKIENPFETGHIKNYILLYVSVVVIMVLFFIASTIFTENKKIEKKEFATKSAIKSTATKKPQEQSDEVVSKRFKLLQKGY